MAGDYFYLQWGKKIPGSNFNQSDVGNDNYGDYRLGIYFKNFFIEVSYKEYIGFNSDEDDPNKSCDRCKSRPELSSRESTLLSFYAFNENFSMKNLTSSGTGGVSAQSSFIAKFFASRLKVRDPGGLFQGADLSKSPEFALLESVEMKQVGLGFGYGQVFPLGSSFYGAFYAGVGGGLQEVKKNKYLDENTSQGASGHWGIRVNLGTQFKETNIGVKGLFFSNYYDLGSSLNLASLNYSLYLYLVQVF